MERHDIHLRGSAEDAVAREDRSRRLRITEIFHSIQGESSYVGRPSYFVRLTGCNLRCVWCDSEYTFKGGSWMSFEAIFAKLESFPACRLVEVTGGEPLLQPAVNGLMRELLERDYTVMLETSGSLDVSPVPRDVIKIVDFKAPGSGESEANLWDNLEVLAPHDELKFVLRDRGDYEWALHQIRAHGLEGRQLLLLSPVFGGLHPRQLSEWMLADGLNARLQLQMHKFIWDPDTQGV